MQLNHTTIAITGGSGGIGSALASALAAHGARIIVIDRVAPSSPNVTYVEGNLGTLEGIEKIAEQLAMRDIDVLINLAGLQYFGMFSQQETNHIALTYHVNLLAPVLLTQAVLPHMKAQHRGHIVNIGSIFASINFAHFATYSSSKAGLKGFSEALRREVKPDGIDVTYIAPRAVNTPLNSGKVMELAKRTKMQMDDPGLVVARIVKAILGREKDVYIGFPESLFVRVNALLPRMVDGALAKNDKIARDLLNSPF